MLELALVTSLESVKIAADMEASSMIGDLKIKVMSSGENRFDASPSVTAGSMVQFRSQSPFTLTWSSR